MARIGKEWTVYILEEALMWQLYEKEYQSVDALRYEVHCARGEKV